MSYFAANFLVDMTPREIRAMYAEQDRLPAAERPAFARRLVEQHERRIDVLFTSLDAANNIAGPVMKTVFCSRIAHPYHRPLWHVTELRDGCRPRRTAFWDHRDAERYAEYARLYDDAADLPWPSVRPNWAAWLNDQGDADDRR